MIRKRVSVGALVLALSLGIGLAAAGSDAEGPWVSTDGTVPTLRLAEVSYDVDVFGTLAVGTLVQSFINESGEIVTVRYRTPGLQGLQAKSVEIEVDGKAVRTDGEKDERVRLAARRGRTRRAQPSGPEIEAEPFDLVSVRVGFESLLGITEGSFHLRLPAPPAPSSDDASEPSTNDVDPTEEAIPASVKVVLHHQDPPLSIDSPSHGIFTDYGPERTVIELADPTGLGGRDFELDFRFGNREEPTLQGYVRPLDENVSEVTAVLTPPSEPEDDAVRAKQMILILDTSGSMGKKSKLERGREALFTTLEQLRRTDTFNIIEFDEGHTSMSDRPLAVGEDSLAVAKDWLDEQQARGSTKLLPALQSAFEQPTDPERHRMVVVLTDGQVHDKDRVERLLQEQQDRFRVFFVGVGEDVDEVTLRRFAEICRGMSAITRESDDLGATAAVLFDSVSRPLAWDLELDWGGAEVERVSPERLPDLYAGRAVTVIARIRGELPPTLKLHGSTVEGDRTFTVVLPDPTEESYRRGTAGGP
jgi:Ca-activated chloride channel family protein